MRVELTGPGNSTPELFALRAYASRFSYVEHYLPRLYWERCFPPEADGLGDATGADFLERFLNNFEGILTPLEDRIARADLVTELKRLGEAGYTRLWTSPGELADALADQGLLTL